MDLSVKEHKNLVGKRENAGNYFPSAFRKSFLTPGVKEVFFKHVIFFFPAQRRVLKSFNVFESPGCVATRLSLLSS